MAKYLPKYDKACSEETRLNDKVNEARNKINIIRPNLDDLDVKREKARQEYDRYDQEYQSIKDEIERINREMNSMDDKNDAEHPDPDTAVSMKNEQQDKEECLEGEG